MYDYMRVLRNKFYTPPGCEELTREYENAHKDLHDQLNREEQKLLLRIIKNVLGKTQAECKTKLKAAQRNGRAFGFSRQLRGVGQKMSSK